jgi:hypothetical protein
MKLWVLASIVTAFTISPAFAAAQQATGNAEEWQTPQQAAAPEQSNTDIVGVWSFSGKDHGHGVAQFFADGNFMATLSIRQSGGTLSGKAKGTYVATDSSLTTTFTAVVSASGTNSVTRKMAAEMKNGQTPPPTVDIVHWMGKNEFTTTQNGVLTHFKRLSRRSL